MKPVFSMLLTMLLTLSFLMPSVTPEALAETNLVNRKLNSDSLLQSEEDFQISPDGTRVVYRASTVAGTRRLLYSAPSDGSAPPVLLSSVFMPGNETVTQFAIAPDSSYVVFLVESTLLARKELYRVPLPDGDVTKLNTDLPDFGSVIGFEISPNSERIVYIADVTNNGSYELFSVAASGGEVLNLTGIMAPTRSVQTDFEISPNSTHVVFRADKDTPDMFELYSATLLKTGVTKLNDPLPATGGVSRFQITPNSTHVVYMANQDDATKTELFRVNMKGPGGLGPAALSGSTKLNDDLVANGNVTQFAISPDNEQVVYLADQFDDNTFELFRVPLLLGKVVRLNPKLVNGGNVQSTFQISPNSAWVVYQADQETDNTTELYAVPIAGGDVKKINSKPAGAVVYFAISPESNYVVYLADQEVLAKYELYRNVLPMQGDDKPVLVAPPRKLNANLVAGGEVLNFSISPDNTRVVYRARQDTATIEEVYSVPLADGDVTKLNTPFTENEDVTRYRISPDGSRVIYRADQDEDQIFEFYAVFEEAPNATITGPNTPLGVGPAEVTVTLSHAPVLSSATVLVTAVGGSALADQDYTFQPGLVTFLPGEQSKAVPVIVLANPERQNQRILNMLLQSTTTVGVGTPGNVELLLAPTPNGVIVYLPMTVR